MYPNNERKTSGSMASAQVKQHGNAWTVLSTGSHVVAIDRTVDGVGMARVSR